ncbi:uncharacterized protein LOC124161180 isoform X2 [Ischnura elegans]|uniref:uncharacterized protein LOC124161180 isoform X2 n=1 Tax=Ischnura elegans TaxID=197161 RepID=UPI001ED8A5D4|nr:uncharacterized protein LOC124161180 isoform X2 [Ischnura elegans]
MSERNTSSRSEVWQYFHKLGIREAQCKICKAIIQKKGSTSSLWGHLRARHVSLKTNHPSIQQNEPSEVDKYSTTNDSTPNNRDRDPLIIDGSGSETSEAKIEEEYSREEQTWVIPDEYESAEDPSEESLTEKNQTVSTNSIPIKITGVASSHEMRSYIMQRLNEAEAEKKYSNCDEDTTFCRLIGAKMKKLTPRKSAEVKIRIMQLLFDAEYGDVN